MNSFRIARDFFKHVPMEKQERVRDKLEKFTKTIIETNVFYEIPKGFWIRKIAGSEIYKFRVNSGDRILFTFNEDGSIAYLSFETHDKQIQAAKHMNKDNFFEFVMDTTEYVEEAIDEKINRYAVKELVGKLQVISQQEVMEDEYVTLLLEDDLFESEKVLTREQFEVLDNYSKWNVVFGCAGSGKTNIGIRRLLLYQESKIPMIYVSHSSYLMNEVKIQFLKKTKTECFIQFFSLHQFYEMLLKHSFTLITKEDFILWYNENKLKSKLTPDEMFLEINTVIKGQAQQRIMTKEQYNECSSDFSLQEKQEIYFIASLYQGWLDKNQYFDLNDLAFFVLQGESQKVESLVFDEIQELTQKQLESVLHVSKSTSNHLLLGDPYQAINNYAFHPNQVFKTLSRHGISYQKCILTKNFRSGHQVVKLLNHIKEQEADCYPTTNNMAEMAIRSTSKPKLILQKQLTQDLLQRLDQDANNILIVPTLEIKKQFQLQGFHRVFVVSEVQGLQYKHVYCQDILQFFSNINRDQHHLYKIYFHLMYVAASRTSQHIYFVESQQPKNIVMNHFEQWDYKSLLEKEYSLTSSLEWLQEARKLELLGKFEQAFDAYKKAEDQDGMTRCQALLLRTRNYQHLEKYLSIVHLDFEIKGPKQIQSVFQMLKDKNIEMIGRAMYFIAEYTGIISFNPYFIEPTMSIEKISQELYNRINYSYAAKFTLHLAGVFYQGNEPILLSEKFNQYKLDDLKFTEKNGCISYKLTRLSNARQQLKAHTEFEKNKQPTVNEVLKGFNVDVVIEGANAKDKKTAEDFLNDIFG